MIATEGSVTEKAYFEEFRSSSYRKNVHVKILPSSRKGGSSPKRVLKRLRRAARESGVRKGDEVWMVIDRDNWTVGDLRHVKRECDKAGYKLAISNPCFELWLLLHQDSPTTPLTCKQCCTDLDALLGGYDKTSYDAKSLLGFVDAAIKRARSMDRSPRKAIPDPPATRVYPLVELLRSA